jgi:hypothetical protein
MINERFPLASVFLLVLGSTFGLAFALPLFLAPLSWAKVFRWTIPGDTRLTVYFGRCLGACAIAIVSICIAAAPHPEANVHLFDLAALAGALLGLVHVWGFVKKTQPWTETAEIPLYGIVTALALFARPVV